MPFIPPMLATRLADPGRIAGRDPIAEPKLDGQRAAKVSGALARPRAN